MTETPGGIFSRLKFEDIEVDEEGRIILKNPALFQELQTRAALEAFEEVADRNGNCDCPNAVANCLCKQKPKPKPA